MKSSDCRATRREIDEADVGRQLSVAAATHVKTCAACGAFRNERANLRELLGSLEPVTAPADFDFKLRARIASQVESPRRFFRSFVLSTPALVGAVLFAVLALSIVSLIPRGGDRAPMVAKDRPVQTVRDNAASDKSPRQDDKTPPVQNGGTEAAVYQPPSVHGPKIKTNRTSQPGLSTNDLNESAARSIKQGARTGDEISVTAPLRPMVLSFQDNDGTTRRIALPPVSFGSQRLVESRTIPVSQVSKTRTW